MELDALAQVSEEPELLPDRGPLQHGPKPEQMIFGADAAVWMNLQAMFGKQAQSTEANIRHLERLRCTHHGTGVEADRGDWADARRKEGRHCEVQLALDEMSLDGVRCSTGRAPHWTKPPLDIIPRCSCTSRDANLVHGVLRCYLITPCGTNVRAE